MNKGKEKMQQRRDTNNKQSGIIAIQLNSNKSYLSTVNTAEVEGEMDGGCQDNLTNLQEGMTKEGRFPNVLHEGDGSDHNPNSRYSTENQHEISKKQQGQQQELIKIRQEVNNKRGRATQEETTRNNYQIKYSRTQDMGNK